MNEHTQRSNSIVNVLRLYRRLLGRKLYVLFVLMPLASLSEGLGIALLLPLIGTLNESSGENTGGLVGRVLNMIPLPQSPIALLGLIAVAFLLKGILKFATDAIAGVFQARVVMRLRVDFLEYYSQLAYSAFAQRNTGHYVNIANAQVRQVARSFRGISQTAMQLVAACVYLALAALTSWQFALMAAIAGLLFIWFMRFVTRRVAELSRKTVAEQASLNANFIQVLQSLKYLIATHRSRVLSQNVQQNCRKLFGLHLRTLVARAFSSSLREPLSALFVLGLVAIHLLFFNHSFESIIVALLLLHRATQRLFGVQASWQQFVEFQGANELVHDEYKFVEANREQRGVTKLRTFSESVQFESVCFSYNDEDGEVLKSINLTIPRNKTIALVGRSGAGKSTIADLLTLLHKPGQGRILIDGVDATELDPRTWRKQLGYVCQETTIFDDTIAANIALGEFNPPVEKVVDSARLAYAEEFILELPDGYETLVGERGLRLSGGQRQRLFIARELYKNPQLLILDEATSALDGASERAIQQSLDALRGRMTVFVIAHRLSTIKNADYIYVLDKGEVVEEGPYQTLNDNSDSKFRQMVELQSL